MEDYILNTLSVSVDASFPGPSPPCVKISVVYLEFCTNLGVGGKGETTVEEFHYMWGKCLARGEGQMLPHTPPITCIPDYIVVEALSKSAVRQGYATATSSDINSVHAY